MIKATFSSHSIRPDGLHIFAVTRDGQEVETIVPRLDAIGLDWIYSEHGVTEEEKLEIEPSIQEEKRQRELAKLETWNSLIKGINK